MDTRGRSSLPGPGKAAHPSGRGGSFIPSIRGSPLPLRPVGEWCSLPIRRGWNSPATRGHVSAHMQELVVLPTLSQGRVHHGATKRFRITAEAIMFYVAIRNTKHRLATRLVPSDAFVCAHLLLVPNSQEIVKNKIGTRCYPAQPHHPSPRPSPRKRGEGVLSGVLVRARSKAPRPMQWGEGLG
jgi:hypothetical protein